MSNFLLEFVILPISFFSKDISLIIKFFVFVSWLVGYIDHQHINFAYFYI